MTAATVDGTATYARRSAVSGLPLAHFKKAQDLTVSSIGLGTYLGAHDENTDDLCEAAVVMAVERGLNVIDTAINYRCQRSERSIGRALETLAARGFPRNGIVVATKGGFLPFDGTPPKDVPAYVERTFVRTGILRPPDIVAGCHSLAPGYLNHQIDASLENLRLRTIDVYYLHNPEMQLKEVSRPELLARLQTAFETLEKAVAAGKIRFYGAATWDGFRKPADHPQLLSLKEIMGIAENVAGTDHHFRFIQLPVNLAMTEAFTEQNQDLDGRLASPLEAANELGLTAMASASIQQGRLTHDLPPWFGRIFKGFTTDAQRALQFARSTPWLTTALVGMKRKPHLEENLAVAAIPPASVEDFLQLFATQP